MRLACKHVVLPMLIASSAMTQPVCGPASERRPSTRLYAGRHLVGGWKVVSSSTGISILGTHQRDTRRLTVRYFSVCSRAQRLNLEESFEPRCHSTFLAHSNTPQLPDGTVVYNVNG